MRTFEDNQGNAWQAAVMEASYGSVMLVFSPLHGQGLRQQTMNAVNQMEAETQLAALLDGELRDRLAEADVWDPSGGQ